MAFHLVGLEQVSLSYPNKVIFDSITAGVASGDRIGILGGNGSGKSTLVKILSGELEPEAGKVTFRRGVRLGKLNQQDSLNGSDSIKTCLVGEASQHEWQGDPKIRSVISGLLGDINLESKIAELSGGQRRRVQLAKLLLSSWDVLVLDEPTNHLDLQGVSWLAEHLINRWPQGEGALLLVTHDRWFLDAVCNGIWEVRKSKIFPFTGGYGAYVLQKLEREKIEQATEAKKRNMLRKELAWLSRGAPARTSKPKFRVEAANALINDVAIPQMSLAVTELSGKRQGKQVVELRQVSIDYTDAEGQPVTVLEEVDFGISAGEKIGILGNNGSGKTTLISVLSGQASPKTGKVVTGETARIGLLSQQFEKLANYSDYRVSEVIAQYKNSFAVGKTEVSTSDLLQQIGFDTDLISTRVSELSGGQSRRLQLLLVLLEQPNCLLLDEPTNDMDIEILTAIENLLDNWSGSLVVVSHDRYFLERVTNQHYAVLSKKLVHMPRGVEQFFETLAEQNLTSEIKESDRNPEAEIGSGAEKYKHQKELSALDRKLDKQRKLIAKLESELTQADPNDYQALADKANEIAGHKDELQRLEESWLELAELVE